MRMGTPFILLCVAAVAPACDVPTAPSTPRSVRVAAEWVTDAAAAAVDPATGLFVIPPGSERVLTRAAADTAALASVRLKLHPATVGNGRSSLEADRGAPVAAWNDLRVCGRAIWVQSPFGPPAADAPRPLLRLMNSAWAHTLCGPRGDAQVAVHTSDTRSGARIIGADYVIADIDSIAQMHHSSGIPSSRQSGAPWPSPEAALRSLFARTGVPISEVPRAQVDWYPPPTVAYYPIWHFTLSAPVGGVLEDGTSVEPFRNVYARFATEDSLEFLIPAPSQPATVWVPHPVSIEPFVLDSIAFPVRHPVVFQRVRPH